MLPRNLELTRRCRGIVLSVTFALLGLATHLAIAPRADALGQLSFAGCISNFGPIRSCDDIPGGTQLAGVNSVVVSPDGGSVYTTAGEGSTVSVFQRDAAAHLTYLECISNTGSEGRCTPLPGSGLELSGPSALAISPDGLSLYVLGFENRTVVTFNRNAQGRLVYAGCLSNRSSLGTCFHLPGNFLFEPRSIEFSPDGNSVYVTAHGSDDIVVFSRSAGGPAYAGCVSNDGSGGLCGDFRGTGVPLDGASGLSISPDGSSVYVGGHGTVAAFERMQPEGQLIDKECFNNDGSGGCVDLPGNPLSETSGLAVSPDGSSVYAVGGVGRTSPVPVVRFARSATGSLTYAECVSDDGSGGLCTDLPGKENRLEEALGVTLSPDGESIYVAAATIVQLRLSGGKLVYSQCVSDSESPNMCAAVPGQPGRLEGVHQVALSPDGISAYAAAFGSAAVTQFARKLAPETSLDSGPAEGSTIDDPKPEFEFSADQPEPDFECATDAAAFAPCSSPKVAGPLRAGSHRFAVRAVTDGDQDPTPATRSFVVAAGQGSGGGPAAPSVKLTKVPRRRLKTSGPKVKVAFRFISDQAGARFLCRMDRGKFVACRSPKRYKVGVGRHRFAVEAVDSSGEAGSPARATFKVVRKSKTRR